MQKSKMNFDLAIALKLAPVFLGVVTCLTLPLNSTIALDKSPLKIAERGDNQALVDLLAQSLPTKNVNTPTSEEIKQVAKMSNARIIHLATTGFLIKSLEIPGVLAFAPSSQDDGWLTGGEVSKLKLNADLVVLSSCDSALGKITGDGVIGLSRAFFVAGANSVIGTLGDIPDASTATLMTEFHSNFSKNPDEAAALRQAMLVTMKQYPNPQDWAMFILVGLP